MPDAYNPWGAPVFPTADDNAMQPETFVPQGVQDWTRQAAPKDYNILSQIAGSLGKALMYPGQVAQSQTPISTEDMVGPAFNLAGMLTLGAGAAPQEANALNMGIKAYHGSPHDFDKFDLSKIGTGEGAQAYGHGLYFAEAEPTAKAYRDQLSYMNKSLNGKQFYGNESPAHGMLSEAMDAGSGIDGAIAKAAQTYQDFTKGPNASYRNAQTAKQALDQLQEWKTSANIAHDPGHMYEVNINADPSHFLDWDKPLSQQPQAMAAFRQEFGDAGGFKKMTLGDAVSEASRSRGKEAISQRLSQTGVPGIKYLDQVSRGAGQGSSNYVVFNHDLIDIMRKYAVPGMLGAPILANALSEQKT